MEQSLLSSPESGTTNSRSEANKYKMNAYIMTAAFFAMFAAFNTVQAFQSQLNKEVGYIGLGLLYGSFCICCIFGPKVVNLLDSKWSMIVGGIPYIAVMIMNVKIVNIVYYIINLCTGFGAAVLWTAEGAYLARCAGHYRKHAGVTMEQATSEFNGIFFSIYQFTGTAGCLFGGLILNYVSGSIMFLVLAIIGSVGLVVLLFLPKVPPVEENDSVQVVSLIETLKLLVNERKMQFSVVIIFFNGLSLGFCFGDFMKFVGDHTSSSWSGYILASFYFANTISSYAYGKLASTKFGRSGIFLLSTCFCGAFYIILFFWDDPPVKTASTITICFALAILFASGDSFFESQIPAILQSFFSSDADRSASMSNLKMWQSLGFAIQFVLGVLIPNDKLWIKSLILLIILIIGSLLLTYLHTKIKSFDCLPPKVELLEE